MYAVIFTSQRRNDDGREYAAMAALMDKLARQQPGFVRMDSARSGLGITVSYWRNEASILTWKQQVDHQVAQQRGQTDWYAGYRVDVCRVERSYTFGSGVSGLPGF